MDIIIYYSNFITVKKLFFENEKFIKSFDGARVLKKYHCEKERNEESDGGCSEHGSDP